MMSSPVPAMIESLPAPALRTLSRSLPISVSLPMPVMRVVISESVLP